MASHIRSGHCLGATEEEVQRFKKEFVYESPKNLVHKSVITKKFRETFEVERYHPAKTPKMIKKNPTRSVLTINPSKKQKVELREEDEINEYTTADLEDCDVVFEEIASGTNNEEDVKDYNEKVEILFLGESEDLEDHKTNTTPKPQELPTIPQQEMSREDKFINAVYPQFKGKTKLQLIEDLIDLKRRNDLLQVKAKNYENTINRLLN